MQQQSGSAFHVVVIKSHEAGLEKLAVAQLVKKISLKSNFLPGPNTTPLHHKLHS
jgi:hypothetical protein